MSRRRSSSNAMGPPPDRDVVMGPPPVPAPASSTASPSKSKDGQDINEKYRKLKRRFFELEEVSQIDRFLSECPDNNIDR